MTDPGYGTRPGNLFHDRINVTTVSLLVIHLGSLLVHASSLTTEPVADGIFDVVVVTRGSVESQFVFQNHLSATTRAKLPKKFAFEAVLFLLLEGIFCMAVLAGCRTLSGHMSL